MDAAVPAASASIPAPAAQPNRRGRSALLVHGLALLAGFGMLVAWWLDDSSERTVFMFVCGAAALVLFGWSMLLSVRAFWAAENLILALAPVLLFAVELNPPMVYLLKHAIYEESSDDLIMLVVRCGLPLLIPFFTLAYALAVLAAWLVSRKVQERPQRLRRGAKVFGIATGVLTLIFLPPLLFVYCSCLAEIGMPGRSRDWRDAVAEKIPDVVRDRTLQTFMNIQADWANDFVYRIVYEGRASPEMLGRLMQSEEADIAKLASEGFIKAYPRRFVDDSMAQYRNATGAARFQAAECIRTACRHVMNEMTPEHVRIVFDHATQTQAQEFRETLGMLICRDGEPALHREVEQCADERKLAEFAIPALAYLSPPGDAERCFTQFIFEPKFSEQRTKAIDCLEMVPLAGRMGIAFKALDSESLALRRSILCKQLIYPARTRLWDKPLVQQFVKRMQVLLNDSDVVVRRGAVLQIHHIFSNLPRYSCRSSPSPGLAKPPRLAIDKTEDFFEGKPPAPEASGEQEELDQARYAVKYLLLEVLD
jgi:hypothetical protein